MKKLVCLLVFCIVVITVNAQITGYKYTLGNKGGFVDANGNWVGQPVYASAYWSEKEQYGIFATEKDGSYGLINKEGKVVFPIGKYKNFHKSKYTEPFVEAEDLSGKKGLVTMDGRVIMPCRWRDIDLLSYKETGLVRVKDFSEKYGVVKEDGTEVVPCSYSKIHINKYIYVTKNDNNIVLKGIYDLKGNVVVECKWSDISMYDYENNNVNLIEVKDATGKAGVIDINGNEVLPCKYKKTSIDGFGKNYIKVTDDNEREGLYSFEGKLLVNCEYASIFYWKERNIIIVENQDGKKGFISTTGKILTDCIYTDYSPASDDILMVNIGGKKVNYNTIGGKWGYFANEKEVVPCIYDEVSKFNNDVAKVKKDGEVKLIKNPLKDGSMIQIAENTSPLNKKERGPVVSRYPAPDSDVDKDIPTTKKQAENSFAFIICNENYPDVPVPYSLNDGRMFKEYCQKALGLPEKNINLYEDATFGNIITAVEKMKQVADAYDGDASIIFYYAGHGFPDEKQQSAYLLPIDGNASDITTTGYSLAKFYKELAAMKLKSAVVFLDACFSGAKREDQMLVQSRRVAIKVKNDVPEGNMIVFSAAQGDETAHQMEEKHHGLFTYFLLKELQATGGDVDMGTLTEYVTKQVKRQSVVINNKKQTPTVIPSQAMTNTWQTLKLR